MSGMRRHPTEHHQQAALIERAFMSIRKYPELRLLFAIPNGSARPSGQRNGKRYSVTGQNLKTEGVRAGVPDLFLPVARGGRLGLFIEIKAKDGRATAHQLAWLGELDAQGYRAELCFGQDHAWAVLVDYLSQPPTRTA